jgi:CDI toxin restriction endonuclease-like domain
LHEFSRTIDDFVDGDVISNKSVDLNADTYQRSSILLSRLNKCIDELEGYSGTNWGGDKIEPSDITRKVLRVIIPEGSMTVAQREAIEAARARAESKGLGFRVVEF